MLLSMTGFGRATTQMEAIKFTVELRGLNSRNLDIKARLPSDYRPLEQHLRKQVADAVLRGKVDLNLYAETTSGESQNKVSVETVNSYVEQLKKVSGVTGRDPERLLQIAMGLPDTLATVRHEPSDVEREAIQKALDEALRDFLRFRESEGSSLAADIEEHLSAIKASLQQIQKMDTDRLKAVRTRLEKAVEKLKEDVDQNRFEQELIFYLEKYDITEEKIRLKKHLDHFTETMENESPNGKKLGFISQEIGREINTIGSKSNDAGMQRVVVTMKDEHEKIKEQLLNVL